MERDTSTLCVGCLLDALADYTRELQKWLDEGGNRRLEDFGPLRSWHGIIKMIAAAQRAGRIPQHLH